MRRPGIRLRSIMIAFAIMAVAVWWLVDQPKSARQGHRDH